MRKWILFFALTLFTLPTFGDDATQTHQVTAEQYGSVRVPESGDEWMYRQEHYGVLERAAKEDEVRQKHRGISAEIEGCKYCQPIDIYTPVYCKEYQIGDEWVTNCSTAPYHCDTIHCSTWTTPVPKEVGNKCTTMSGTTDISTFLTNDHQASSSMTMFLNQRLSLTPEQIAGGFTPYQWSLEGGSSCSGASSTTQTWTTDVGNGYQWSSQVKIWSCGGVSGSACSADTQVQP
jgi:hypothetical protein